MPRPVTTTPGPAKKIDGKTDKRRANADWCIYTDKGWQGPWTMHVYMAMQLAVLMDVRDELQRLNILLHCRNATEIPLILREIRDAVRR